MMTTLTPLPRLASRLDVAAFRKTVRGTGPLGRRAHAALTVASDSSKLWFGVAAALGAAGGDRGRRAAARGLVAIGATSALANGPLKKLVRRDRPRGLVALGVPHAGRPPKTSSFPSGHAASAFAFATAAGLELPVLAAPLLVTAGAVGWSRIESAQHYPGDVLAGALVGVGVGLGVRAAWPRLATLLRRHTPAGRASAAATDQPPCP